MHHSTVHTTCLNRLHTTWYVVMQDKKLKPREAFNSFFPLIAMIRQATSSIAITQGGYSTVRSPLRSRRRTELHTDLRAGEANNAVNWFPARARDRDRDQGKEKLLEGIIVLIITKKKKEKEINSECEKSQWK